MYSTRRRSECGCDDRAGLLTKGEPVVSFLYLNLMVMDGIFAVCRLGADATIPPWATASHFFSIMMNDNYTSWPCCLTEKCNQAVQRFSPRLTCSRSAISVSWRQVVPAGSARWHILARTGLVRLAVSWPCSRRPRRLRSASRVKRSRALLASNPTRDNPADGAPMASQEDPRPSPVGGGLFLQSPLDTGVMP